jgi:hypothetical protein
VAHVIEDRTVLNAAGLDRCSVRGGPLVISAVVPAEKIVINLPVISRATA